MTHDNATDIVEQAKAEWDALAAPDVAVWASANVPDLIEVLSALIERDATLRKQLENAREALHSIEGQAVCVALPHKATEADDMLENIAGIAARALESIYTGKGQP